MLALALEARRLQVTRLAATRLLAASYRTCVSSSPCSIQKSVATKPLGKKSPANYRRNTHTRTPRNLFSSYIGTDIPIRIVARSRSRSREIRAYMAASEDWRNRVNVSDLAALRCTTFAFRETLESAAPRRRNAADVAAAGVKERTANAIFKSNSNSSHSDNLFKNNNHAPPSQIARPPYLHCFLTTFLRHFTPSPFPFPFRPPNSPKKRCLGMELRSKRS